MQLCAICEMKNVKQSVSEFEIIPEKFLRAMRINCFKKEVDSQANL